MSGWRPPSLRVVTEWLGLRQRDIAGILGVDERTVRSWLAGKHPIPDGVRLEIEAVEERTALAVGEVVAGLRDAADRPAHTPTGAGGPLPA